MVSKMRWWDCGWKQFNFVTLISYLHKNALSFLTHVFADRETIVMVDASAERKGSLTARERRGSATDAPRERRGSLSARERRGSATDSPRERREGLSARERRGSATDSLREKNTSLDLPREKRGSNSDSIRERRGSERGTSKGDFPSRHARFNSTVEIHVCARLYFTFP